MIQKACGNFMCDMNEVGMCAKSVEEADKCVVWVRHNNINEIVNI